MYVAAGCRISLSWPSGTLIAKRQTKGRGAVYDVRLRDASGRVYTRTFRTKKEAERFEATERADRASGAYPGRVERLVNTWSSQLGTRTVRRQYAVLSAIMTFGLATNRIVRTLPPHPTTRS